MQIKKPGLFSRGKIILDRPSPHITPDSLLNELTQNWGPRGFTVYKSALPLIDVTLKQSAWTGIGFKIKHSNEGTTVVYGAFSPSAFARMFGGPLIFYFTSWAKLCRSFEGYVQGSPFFGGSMQLQQGQGMPQQGMPQQGMPQQQAMPQQAAAQPQGGQQQYPCPRCQGPLQWAAQYNRWFCARCQQYA
ncbi:MAG TPA: hypothetical protein VL463_21165 [Kofleriaceae bacterium]|jgi:hypothetical protein|nr:hypothetical protein [Kofleriaceae bacterium]